MKVSICVCTACHVAGAKQLVETLKTLVRENGLEERVTLSAKFSDHDCTAKGVTVLVDDKRFVVDAKKADAFFHENILAALA